MNQDMIDPRAEQTRDFQLKELGEFVGKKSKKPINK
jgi:hypothetical protein